MADYLISSCLNRVLRIPETCLTNIGTSFAFRGLSYKRRSDCERDASALGHQIGEKGDSPKEDLWSAIQIDDRNEDKESSLKQPFKIPEAY
ncbi:hypothetical protein Tco_1464403 [Tanacetum coccineum]